MADANLTAARLREVLSYDPATGVFTWANPPGVKMRAGQAAGSLNTAGYTVIRVDKRLMYAHRLAWLYCHGVWPERFIDHISGDRSDNRIENLRDVSCMVNAQNIKSSRPGRKYTDLLGAHWCARFKVWKSSIRIGSGRVKRLGSFGSDEEAHAAYLAAKRLLHEGCTI